MTLRHPEAEELIDYEEGQLDQDAAERLREHLGTCDVCLDDLEDHLKEKLRADLHRLREPRENSLPDVLEMQIQRDNERLVDEPVHREAARKMFTRFGAGNDEVLGPLLRLLNEFDERIETLKSERR